MTQSASKNQRKDDNQPRRYRTLADIARALQLDPSTVSLVLSGSDKPSEKTRRRVLAFCKKVNFRPNLLARSLSKGQSGLWGVLFPDIQSSFFPRILEGIESVANSANCTAFLALSKYDPELMRSQIDKMLARQVDGFLIVPTGKTGEREILKPLLADVPKVAMILPFEGEPMESCVHMDDLKGSMMATEHLIGLGHRRIGLLSGEAQWLVSQLRMQGWRRALEAAGLDAGEDLVVSDCGTRDAGYRAAQILLDRPQPPTAIFAANDYMALGACGALLDRNLHPGVDVAIVGYDDLCCSYNSPIPLTTVCQPKEELGVIAAELLLAVIKGETVTMPCLTPTLKIRQSCGAKLRAGVSAQENG